MGGDAEGAVGVGVGVRVRMRNLHRAEDSDQQNAHQAEEDFPPTLCVLSAAATSHYSHYTPV